MMNTGTRAVRNHPRPGGAKAPQDRRIRRTQRALAHALIALIAEKRYEEITIQDLLDRADVGRSTFYAHYRGKDDFLLRTFEGLLDQLDQCVGPADERLAPVQELFAHVGGQREFHRALARAKMLDRVYQTGTEHMSRAIERRLIARSAERGMTVPPAVEARAYAGALFALLRWWIDEASPPPPDRMDAMFHGITIRDAQRARTDDSTSRRPGV